MVIHLMETETSGLEVHQDTETIEIETMNVIIRADPGDGVGTVIAIIEIGINSTDTEDNRDSSKS